MMNHPLSSGLLRQRSQRGMTLLELMVALTISLIVVLAALAALLFAREGFTTVDTASQLRENTRFATELISRVVMQAGYQEWSGAEGNVGRGSTPPDPPDIQGANNAVFSSATIPPVDNSRDSGCGTVTDTSCVNGSDVLIVRYQGMNKPGGGADGSMINCSGQPQAAVTNTSGLATGRATSAFYVDRNSNDKEPVLMCATTDSTGAWQTPIPLMEGVETFQVLYGCDSVNVNTAPSSAVNPPVYAVTRWLRADQLFVTGNVAGTNANWQRVRAVRIGIVMRSPVSLSGPSATAATLYPFLDGTDSALTAPSNGDSHVPLSVPADRRTRQAFTFTVNLRNSLI